MTSAAQAPLVEAPAGSFQGVEAGGLNVFKGIPYARPPVGDLRWRAPEPAEPRSGTLVADQFGPACIQPRIKNGTSVYADDIGKVNEDCLTLNIWAPADAEKAPVFVWIHGGALRAGSAREALYDGTNFANKGLVVVSINYRLGVLGYLAHPELSAESPDGVSGNYGLLDQIAALEWVRDNIAAFGGDPSNVTIAGESAGALSAMYLMAAPAADGLFHKAILESAYMASTPALKEAVHGHPSAESEGVRIAAALGADGIAALRAMDAKTVYANAAKAGYAPFGTIDGKVLPQQIAGAFDSHMQADVPVIAGFNSGEIRTLRLLAPKSDIAPDQYEATIRAAYGDLADDFLALYPSGDLEESIIATTRDALYGWTAERLVRKQAERGTPSYLYLFDHGYDATDSRGLHAFHGSELPFVFGTMDRTPPNWPAIPETPAEQRMSDAMLTYWASFAATGAPAATGEAAWLPYGGEENFIAFADVPEAKTNLMPGMFELHEETVCRRREAGTMQWNWNTGLWSPVLPADTGACD
ncbi:MAG: carboxylesterase family protein [Hyphomonas sp.]|nr:carboxylesterase family protein [Hyphomonas sp.]